MDLARRTILLLGMVVFGFPVIELVHAEMVAPKKHAAGFDMKQVDRGRYLSMTSGCNDCHTPGYLLSEGKVAENLWLTGDRFGWRGPWGTTYAPNLRLLVKGMTEDQWVAFARTLKSRPPMPWFNLNKMQAVWTNSVTLGDLRPDFRRTAGQALLSVHNRVELHFAGHSFKRV